MHIGERVVVCTTNNTYRKYLHEEGTIERTYHADTTIGVRLDNFTNKSSQYGLFWFKQKEIKIINQEEPIMLQNFIPVTIRFLEGTNTDRDYHYALYDPNIHIGDDVLVNTGHHGLGLAQVSGGYSGDPIEKKKVLHGREIVCKVDMSAFRQRRKDEVRAAQLKALMDERVEQLQADAVLLLLAEKDPALAGMLKDYNRLTTGTITTAEGDK